MAIVAALAAASRLCHRGIGGECDCGGEMAPFPLDYAPRRRHIHTARGRYVREQEPAAETDAVPPASNAQPNGGCANTSRILVSTGRALEIAASPTAAPTGGGNPAFWARAARHDRCVGKCLTTAVY